MKIAGSGKKESKRGRPQWIEKSDELRLNIAVSNWINSVKEIQRNNFILLNEIMKSRKEKIANRATFAFTLGMKMDAVMLFASKCFSVFFEMVKCFKRECRKKAGDKKHRNSYLYFSDLLWHETLTKHKDRSSLKNFITKQHYACGNLMKMQPPKSFTASAFMQYSCKICTTFKKWILSKQGVKFLHCNQKHVNNNYQFFGNPQLSTLSA